MRKLRLLSIALFISMLPALTGCGPNYASKGEILKYAQNEARGENLVIEREVKEHTYEIRSEDRDLYFLAYTYAQKMSCDGADFGYSGETSIRTEYFEAIYKYWFEDAKALLDVDGFDWVRFMRNEDNARTFKFYVDADVPTEDLDKIEDFMFALREILRKEQEFHTKNIDICYNVAIMKHFPEDQEKAYHRCAGNDGYNTKINSDTPDIELNVQRMGNEANGWIENTEPDENCCVIMMYNEDNT